MNKSRKILLKKVVSLSLSLVLCLCLLPTGVQAIDGEAEAVAQLEQLLNDFKAAFSFNGGSVSNEAANAIVSGTCGPNATWSYNTTTDTLTISGSGVMDDYGSESYPPWLSYMYSCKRLIISSGITYIGNCSFLGCDQLYSVSLPSTLVLIGEYAFAGDISLTSISLPVNLAIIGLGAFQNTGLTSVMMPSSLTAIGQGAFLNCTSLSSVALNKGLTLIMPIAFDHTAIRSIEIPESVDGIGAGAFAECTALKTATFLGNPSIMDGNIFGGSNSVTIHCKSGTNPAEYAREYNIPVIYTDSDLFTDVPEGALYYDAVYWAKENGITTGTSPTMFSPNAPCSRAQIVTFLWRVKGEPEPRSYANPFRDVPTGIYYYKAVLWAYHEGITTGTSATTFGPNQSCTRGQCVVFLWRTAGSPNVAVGTKFKDVKSDAFYAKAVYWAYNNGITTGTSSTAFSPNMSCSRGQIVTFLYRYAG